MCTTGLVAAARENEAVRERLPLEGKECGLHLIPNISGQSVIQRSSTFAVVEFEVHFGFSEV